MQRHKLTVWVEDLGRPNLVLRWIDQRGHQRQRTANTPVRRTAEREAAKLETELAELADRPPEMAWEAFARLYTRDHAATLDQHTARHWQSVLAKLDDFGSPAWLADLDERYLTRFAAWTLERGGRPRRNPDGTTTPTPASPATLTSYLKRIHHALRWAADKHYLEKAPRIPPPARAPKRSKARGRPLALEEFERMLAATAKRNSARTAKGLRRILRGLWASGLRLAELLDLHWTRADHWRPLYLDDPHRAPLLEIPAHRQKSRRAESIPCPPEFAEMLRRCQSEARHGRIFHLAGRHHEARSTDYIARLIAQAGRTAGIVVHRYANGTPKYASAHDLRRTFAQRWADRGLSELELAAIMRHSSIETTRQYYLERNEERLARRMAALAPQEPKP